MISLEKNACAVLRNTDLQLCPVAFDIWKTRCVLLLSICLYQYFASIGLNDFGQNYSRIFTVDS